MRVPSPILLFAAVCLSSCSASFDDKGMGAGGGSGSAGGPGSSGGGSDDGGEDGDGNGEDNGPGTISQLDDLKASLQRDAEGCQDVDDIPHEGAASYFYGELQPVQGSETPMWEGREEWLLYANESWLATGVNDCAVTWNIQAEEIDAGACAACDITLAVAATVDIARTSCPEGLWENDANYTVSYDVIWDAAGDSNWFFAASGTPMGTGSHVDGAMNYITARSCVWF